MQDVYLRDEAVKIRAKHARQIREGIKQARQPYNIQSQWLMANLKNPVPYLVMVAFARELENISKRRIGGRTDA